MSQLTSALIVDAVVLAVVLLSDLGQARRIDRRRILRPIIVAIIIIPIFIQTPQQTGTGLVIEVIGVLAGILAGSAVLAVIEVLPGRDGAPAISRAGVAYAAIWIVLIAARAAFSWGAHHWFAGPLEHWLVTDHVTAAAITDALVFMAVAMVLTRTAGLAIRANRLTPSNLTTGRHH